MFPSMTDSRQNKRSLRELVRGAMDTALEFVTLGEAHAPVQHTQAHGQAVSGDLVGSVTARYAPERLFKSMSVEPRS